MLCSAGGFGPNVTTQPDTVAVDLDRLYAGS
jgi:hypothetical protein